MKKNKKMIYFFSDSFPPLNDATSKYNFQIIKELNKSYLVKGIHIILKDIQIKDNIDNFDMIYCK